MATIKLTFAQLREANLPLSIKTVHITPQKAMWYTFANPTLWGKRPWGSAINDPKAEALFAQLGPGDHVVIASYV